MHYAVVISISNSASDVPLTVSTVCAIRCAVVNKYRFVFFSLFYFYLFLLYARRDCVRIVRFQFFISVSLLLFLRFCLAELFSVFCFYSRNSLFIGRVRRARSTRAEPAASRLCVMHSVCEIEINNGPHSSKQVSIWAECIRRKL